MSLQSRLEAFVSAVGADVKKMVRTDGDQTITGIKTFGHSSLFVVNQAGTITAQPFSEVSPPEFVPMFPMDAGDIYAPGSGIVHVYTDLGKILQIKDLSDVSRPVDMSWENCPFSATGALTVKVGVNRYPVTGGTFRIQTVAAMVNTAPTGSGALIVDVNKNGTSIYGTQANRPTITSSQFSATVGAHTATTVTTGDYLTVDIDQVGSTVAGSDLVVVVRMQRIA